jgi:hypothetical protein|tara:strand:+ start:1235 stop:1456 length:222 start_codon:yes stop_codon:yes gene_type:complete
MREKHELRYCNISDLRPDELEQISDYDLNSCDKCGIIDDYPELFWIDYDFNFPSKYVALCEMCFDEEKPKCFK